MSNQKILGKKIGTICQNLRKAKGMSQAELAEAVGVSLPTIGKLETGSPMSFKNMVKLLDYFGEIGNLEKALDQVVARTNEDDRKSAERVRYDALMAKVKEGYRLNLEEFEFCIGVVPRKEYPIIEPALRPIRLAGMGVRLEPVEDEYYGATVGYIKELRRRKDARFKAYRMGEKGDFAWKVL